ncbi:PIN domain-containing protein [uncultured Lacinutrix sp.]|uniref:PIN domain-containing protein n=1 Tax=uncultured Lacinutrix sp. TaxID=574032 RepID=UPI002607F7BD|nr:PIN domain-containing protein [uncultured Lacinutrix sp.]
MKNILIDTCSWINLLSEDFNKLLPHLEFWKNNNCIRIISHEKIIEEWNFHKDRHKKRLADSLNTKYNHTRAVAKKERISILETLSPNLDEIENQIKLIDDLLIDSKILKTSDEIKVFCADWQISKKAPFHDKVDSMKDAYIIFSALNHFTDVNEEFIFISDNKNDFGSKTNPNSEIHPEILENYSEVNLRYFKDIGKAINTLRQELPISLLPEEINSTSITSIENEVVIDKTKPILEQVYDYISIRHKEIKFYPISLFINNYPFKIDSTNYYSTFNLSTDNEELIELFQSVHISEDNKISIIDEKFYYGVENYKTKIKTVLLGLSNNLIFNISSDESRERISIRYSEAKNCECPKCSFKKFKFYECFENLDSYTDSIEDLQESSYLNYKIGNYLLAIEKQKKVLIEYKKKQLNTSFFIAQFNLSKLLIFARNSYFGDNSKNELLEELKTIDLDYEETNLSSKENKKIIKYINDSTFYNDARNKIHETSHKLIDQYYSSLNGGLSLNNHVWILINEFAKLEIFLSKNYIVYDKFKEFQDVFSIFIEGLFASHAVSESHENSRLDSFDDWLIINLLQYGNSEIINKSYRRYKLKKINYKKTSLNGDSFEELIDNFFNNNSLKKSLNENCERDNRRFWEHYNRVFKNILALVSISNFEKEFINSFSKQLVNYLENEPFIQRQSIKEISVFLYRCGKQIDSELIYRFFDLGINNSFYHDSNFYESILSTLDRENKHLNITVKQFETIKSISFNECTFCSRRHENTLIIPLYRIIDNLDFKKEIVSMIQAKLKGSFSFDLFYEASILELIPLNNEMLIKAIEVSIPRSRLASSNSLFSNVDDNRFVKLNSILNLCFKFNIDTTTEQFTPLRKLDSYYDWLLDMDNFNYDLFKAKWIGEYSTRFYYEKIYNNKIVKEKLDSIIKYNFDSNIEKEYLNIYVRKTWNISKK